MANGGCRHGSGLFVVSYINNYLTAIVGPEMDVQRVTLEGCKLSFPSQTLFGNLRIQWQAQDFFLNKTLRFHQ